jgi:hypothetical protein
MDIVVSGEATNIWWQTLVNGTAMNLYGKKECFLWLSGAKKLYEKCQVQ